jgi:hypothetical protein
MAELVDAPDLGSGIERCAGSSPVSGTFSRFSNHTLNSLINSDSQPKASEIQTAKSASECPEMHRIAIPIARSVAR